MTGAARHYVLAAGGTGGHLIPAFALAVELERRGHHVALVTDSRGAKLPGKPDSLVAHVLPAGRIGKNPLHWPKGIGAILEGKRMAERLFESFQPSCVVGFGGYPTIPALTAAFLTGRPRMIHEQNGVLGRVNKLFARRVHKVACGTWPTALPSGVTGEHTGNPVRAAVMERAGAGYIAPGDYPMDLVVIGGSQGARVLSDVVPAAIAQLPENIRQHLRVAQQARPEDLDRVVAAYAEAGIMAEIAPFFADIPRRLSEAQLVISRSGASSVADISVIGRPSVLIPFAAATDDHQTANAQGLVEAGGAVLIAETALDAAGLAQHITAILGQPQRAEDMARAALGQGRPDATIRLVALVEALAGKG